MFCLSRGSVNRSFNHSWRSPDSSQLSKTGLCAQNPCPSILSAFGFCDSGSGFQPAIVFVGDVASAHNLLQRGALFIMRLHQLLATLFGGRRRTAQRAWAVGCCVCYSDSQYAGTITFRICPLPTGGGPK